MLIPILSVVALALCIAVALVALWKVWRISTEPRPVVFNHQQPQRRAADGRFMSRKERDRLWRAQNGLPPLE